MKKQGVVILFSILVFVFLAEAKPQPPGIFKSCTHKLLEDISDGYCDDQLNTPECGYDGGDCCAHKKDNWDEYCEDCQCHIEDFDCADYNDYNTYNKDWVEKWGLCPENLIRGSSRQIWTISS
eukprot:08204.XXX_408979_409423_1 [CDS] Oithona nana genome sequencing.